MEEFPISPFKNISLYVGIVVIAIVTLAALGIFRIYKSKTAISPTEPSPPPQTFESISSPSPTPNPVLGANAPQEQPAAGSDTSQVTGVGIRVDFPLASSSITSPVKVAGSANVLEGKLTIVVKDSKGTILGQALALACESQNACAFEAIVEFDKPTTRTGTVEVYNPTPVSPQAYKQIIPVSFY